jgi:hypothetical protein
MALVDSSMESAALLECINPPFLPLLYVPAGLVAAVGFMNRLAADRLRSRAVLHVHTL